MLKIKKKSKKSATDQETKSLKISRPLEYYASLLDEIFQKFTDFESRYEELGEMTDDEKGLVRLMRAIKRSHEKKEEKSLEEINSLNEMLDIYSEKVEESQCWRIKKILKESAIKKPEKLANENGSYPSFSRQGGAAVTSSMSESGAEGSLLRKIRERKDLLRPVGPAGIQQVSDQMGIQTMLFLGVDSTALAGVKLKTRSTNQKKPGLNQGEGESSSGLATQKAKLKKQAEATDSMLTGENALKSNEDLNQGALLRQTISCEPSPSLEELERILGEINESIRGWDSKNKTPTTASPSQLQQRGFFEKKSISHEDEDEDEDAQAIGKIDYRK